MRRLAAISTAAFVAMGSYAAAQAVLLDDFEADTSDWGPVNAWTTIVHVTDDGAAGTNASLQAQDAGWGMDAGKEYEGVIPEDGNYKITFWYKNGMDGGEPWPNFRVRVDGNHEVNLGSDTVLEWTEAETGVGWFEEDDSFLLEAYTSYSGTVDELFRMRLDEIYLVPVDVAPIGGRIAPPNNLIVGGTQTVEVFPTGGSGNYVQADFYLDDTLVHTDDTPGDSFTWEFDTTAEPDVTVDVRVEVTDDDANTGEIEASYVIDNLMGRTDNLVENGLFESWDAGLPTSWTVVNLDPDGDENPAIEPVITEETENPFVGTSALSMEYAENPSPHRYTLLSNPIPADRFDYQIWCAVRGSTHVRLFYFQTEDGVTWTSTWASNSPGAGPVWVEDVSSPYTPEGDDRPQNLAVATHYFGTGTGYWDAVHVAASEESVDPVSVEQWDLYH